MKWCEIEEDDNYSLNKIEDFAYSLIDVVTEVRGLKKENAELRKKLKERDNFVDEQFKNAQKQVGGILSMLVERSK